MLGWAVLLLVLAACSAEPAPRPTVPTSVSPGLNIGLSDSSADLPQLVPDPFERHNVLPLIGNDATLMSELDAGLVDAVLVHALPPAVEREGTRWFNPIAVDGLAIIVHPDNPVTDLTLADVQGVFSGQIGNWRQLNGPDLAVEPVSREPGAGARTLLAQRVMAEQRVSINAVVQPSSRDVRAFVAANPGAVGYVMLGSLPRATTDADLAVRLLSLDGVAPTPLTLAAQSYLLTAPLFVVTRDSAEPQGSLRAFIADLQSAEGQTQLGARYGRVR